MYDQSVTEDVGALPQELPNAELVLAFVSPLGTPLDMVQDALAEALLEHHYELGAVVRISSLLGQMHDAPVDERPEARQLRLIEAGNDLRRKHGSDHLALMAIAHINATRLQDETGEVSPFERKAHIIRSLKHPEEVARLRQVYGKGFFLLGVSAPRKLRRETLQSAKDFPLSEAKALLEKDAGEAEKIGQQTRDTFELADAFLWVDDRDGNRVKQKVRRIVDLLFSCPFHPPTKDEHAMFMAYAAALRSSDLSRQVGAIVTNRAGDVVASGANDAPAPEGATYWPPVEFTGETSDVAGPDYLRGYDSNERERNKILAGVIAALVPDEARLGDLSPDARGDLVERYRDRLKGTGILDLTEFGRAVHAEMAALMSCARSGAATVGGTLYCTTFPCHNCAKHIIAAGITRVVYVEPYPKSKAKDLHADAIFLPHEDDASPDGPRVELSAFEGIGPRRFVDLFSLSLGNGRPVRRKEKGADGARIRWERGEGSLPRLPLDSRSYLEREDASAKYYRRQQSSDGKLPSPEPPEDTHGRDQAQELAADHPDPRGGARRSEASGGSGGEVARVEAEAIAADVAGEQREPEG